MEGMVSVSQMPSLSTPEVCARLLTLSLREIICTHFIDGLFEPERRDIASVKSWSQTQPTGHKSHLTPVSSCRLPFGAGMRGGSGQEGSFQKGVGAPDF